MTQQTISKRYQNGNQLQTQVLNGINRLADNVASTLGPRGRNVILHKKGANPIITKDGVTVADFISFDDPFENVGAQIIKQVASQTNALAGDGTTTSTVLARAILEHSQKYLAAGSSPVELKKGIDKAVKFVVEYIYEMSSPVNSQGDIKNIAKISANGDEAVASLITAAIDQAGRDGSITIEEAKSMETTLEVVEGFRFDSGYFAKAFVTDQRRNVCRYNNPLILITNYRIETVEDVYPVLELASRDSRPLVIIAEEVEGQALAAMIMNAARGTMKVVAVKAPRYGEERKSILEDLCVATGATFISRDSDRTLKSVKLEDFGYCKTIEIMRNLTTIVDGKGRYADIEKRIDIVKEQIMEEDDIRVCEGLQERITRLASGVAIIKVGAPTEIEMIEKKHRIEDALEAVKSAQEEGIIPGGGATLVRAAKNIDIDLDSQDQMLGVEIIKQALSTPLRQMAKNAGKSPDIIVSLVEDESDGYGYDFNSGEIINMLEEGIVDPAKVTRVALQNAASAASTLITTNYAIIEV